MSVKVIENTQCPECHCSSEIKQDFGRGEIVCTNCGFVISDILIDQGPEWRPFQDKIERVRTGMPPAIDIFDKGMNTSIDRNNVDYANNRLNPDQRIKAYKFRKWQKRSLVTSGLDRNLYIAMSELDLVCSILELTKTVKRIAAKIYRDAIVKNKLRVKEIRGTVIAAVYMACRLAKAPLVLRDFTRKVGIKRKRLTSSLKALRKSIDIKLTPVDPNNYIARFCNELRLSKTTQDQIVKMVEKVKETPTWGGRNPTKLLAGIIYIQAILQGERRTQAEVARACNVSEVTVRSRYKDIVKELKINWLVV